MSWVKIACLVYRGDFCCRVRPGAHRGDGLLARMTELAFTLARFSANTRQDHWSPKALDAKRDLEIYTLAKAILSSGGSRGGAGGGGGRPSLNFLPKWGPKSRKNFFGDRAPLISGSGLPSPPPLSAFFSIFHISKNGILSKNQEK